MSLRLIEFAQIVTQRRQFYNIDVRRGIYQVVLDAQHDCSGEFRVMHDLVIKARRMFLDLDRASIGWQAGEAEAAQRTIVAPGQVNVQIQAEDGQRTGRAEQVGFVDVPGIHSSMVCNDAVNLECRPGNVLRRPAAPFLNFPPPQFALIVSMEAQRTTHFFEDSRTLCITHRYCDGDEYKMAIRMKDGLHVDAFEVRSRLEPVPVPDRLSDGLAALDAIVSDLPSNGLSILQLVVAANSGEGAACDAIGGLQQDRTTAALAEELPHVVRHIVEVILGSPTLKAGVFCL